MFPQSVSARSSRFLLRGRDGLAGEIIGASPGRHSRGNSAAAWSFEGRGRGQFGQVGGDMDAALVQVQQFDLFGAGRFTQDQAERRVFAGLAFVAVEVAEVEFHLAFEGGFELAELQVEGDEPAQFAMVEEKVAGEVFAIDDDSLLASDEGEAGTEFEQE